jgi:hypothetical protein
MLAKFRVFILLVILGLIGYVLLFLAATGDAPRSAIWFFEPLLYAIFILGIWVRQKRGGPLLSSLSSGQVRVLFLVIGLAAALLYESTLGIVDPKGNFNHLRLVLIGYYTPALLIFLFLIGRYGYTLPELYFAGAAASFTESVVFGGALLPWLFSPAGIFLAGYFCLVYGSIITVSLVFIDERLLWEESPRPIHSAWKITLGFLTAFVSYLIFAGWGLLLETLIG